MNIFFFCITQNKQNRLPGLKENLHQSEFVFYPEASALIFQLMMPSEPKIMILYSVEVKLVYKAKTPKTKRQKILVSQTKVKLIPIIYFHRRTQKYIYIYIYRPPKAHSWAVLAFRHQHMAGRQNIQVLWHSV